MNPVFYRLKGSPKVERSRNPQSINILNTSIHKKILDLKCIAANGGNLVVDANGYTMYDLKAVAAAGKISGANLTINNADKFSGYDCKIIASENPGHVTFNFSK